MDPGPDPEPHDLDFVRGILATIGFQTPSGSFGHTIRNARAIPIFGEVQDRTFTYSPAPSFEPNGSFQWHPLASDEEVIATLRATRGAEEITESVTVRFKTRPEILINGPLPTEPLQVGTIFRLGWTTTSATALEVLNQAGAVVCTAWDQLAVEQGACSIAENVEGRHSYTLRATGAGGAISERSFEVTYSEPLSILRFDADKLEIDKGDSLTLSWETAGASDLSLIANGESLPVVIAGSGDLEIPALEVDTTFILRASNAQGLIVEEELFIRVWSVKLTLTASETTIRPGTPITIQVTAADLGGGPAPYVYGTLPMVEVDPPPAYLDISSWATALSLPDADHGSAAIELPEGFEFPYFGMRYSQVWATADGYLSFIPPFVGTGWNVPLPFLGPDLSYKAVHLAPFWDDLNGMQGVLSAGLESPDVFVIQWKGWRIKPSGLVIQGGAGGSSTQQGDASAPILPFFTTETSEAMNFQLALHRDGSFAYRYGGMAPPPIVGVSCAPDTCANEANGSSATIGYQATFFRGGSSLHHGGQGRAASNVPFPGGLSNRVFRYNTILGEGVVTLLPGASETYTFCVETAGDPACKSISVEAPFAIQSFSLDQEEVGFGESTTLRWQTEGGSRIRILDPIGALLLDESDLGIVDSGALTVAPGASGSYTLELISPVSQLVERVQLHLIRAKMSLSAPATATPGQPVTLSWVLDVSDPSLAPVIVAPMEEDPALLFRHMDIAEDPGATLLWGAGATQGLYTLDFDGDFTFDYLGSPMTSVKVSVEGYLTFAETWSSTPTNQPIPSPTLTFWGVHIAPFWDDLSAHTSGRVLAKRMDADTYVIQWSRMSLTQGSTSGSNEFDLNFLVVLHRNGDFEFRYGDMRPGHLPTSNQRACYPVSCEKEANGGAATIGYQDQAGLSGFLLHNAGVPAPNANNKAVPGGLGNRSWKFTRSTARTGSVQVSPWDPTLYNVCAIDPPSQETFCPAAPLEIDASWGIRVFDATPWAVLPGATVTLEWETVGLDELRLSRNGVQLLHQVGTEIVPAQSMVEDVHSRSIYVLEGSSLGRQIAIERVVHRRNFDLEVVVPSGKHFPGDPIELRWELTPHEAGAPMVNSQMFEVEASRGAPGAYVDISQIGGASQHILTGANENGRYILTLPFPFPFLGASYTAAQAMVDGYLTFDMEATSGVAANRRLPFQNNPWVHIAPFWDDLHAWGAAQLWTHSPGPDSFIIQWKGFSRAAGSSATEQYDLNWQIVLFADGAFEFRYGTLAPPPGIVNSSCFPSSCELEAQGSSATVGYQSVDQRLGRTLHFGGNNAAAVRPFPDGLANRSFRFEARLSASESVTIVGPTEETICAALGDFFECRTVSLETVVLPGDLMFTELMLSPDGGQREQWFEVRNLSPEPIDLEGFELRSLRGSFPITSSLLVPSLGHVVFAASSVPAYLADAVYGASLPLDPGLDSLELFAGPMAVTTLSWDASWLVPPGRTVFLDPAEQIHGRPTPTDFRRWCIGSQIGSPGEGDETCLP